MTTAESSARVTLMLEEMTVEQLKRTVMVFIEKSDKYEQLYHELQKQVKASHLEARK